MYGSMSSLISLAGLFYGITEGFNGRIEEEKEQLIKDYKASAKFPRKKKKKVRKKIHDRYDTLCFISDETPLIDQQTYFELKNLII